ncbi:MAG: hypothetical protein A4E24_00888 [Methanomethylovorans sp. PtaU1.Bin093]|nr:MAG: hypothetical protein A4E24_00888 [Methanomethylovorans sp. PtaU1.Bin093]
MVVKEQKKSGSKKPAQEGYHTYPYDGSQKRK